MPTGYTSQLLDKPDMSFTQFALLCSRAFGALIDMRDDPLDTPIPTEVKPSDYHKKALFKAWGQKGRAKQLTARQRKAKADAAMLADLRYHATQARKDAKTRAIYLSMLDKVRAWNPPTPEHQNLKSFMIQQLEDSLRVDECIDYHQDAIAKTLETDWKVWWSNFKQNIVRDVEYHTKEHREEVKRCQGRTKWIQDLMTSLGINPAESKTVPSIATKNSEAWDVHPHKEGEEAPNPFLTPAQNKTLKNVKRAHRLGKLPLDAKITA